MNKSIEEKVSEIKKVRLEKVCLTGHDPSPNMYYGQTRHQKVKNVRHDLITELNMAIQGNKPPIITVNKERDGTTMWQDDDYKPTKNSSLVKDTW